MFEPDLIRIPRTWTCQTESESSLPRDIDRAEDRCKNSLRSDLRASNLKKFFLGVEGPPAAACFRTLSHTRPEQFNFTSARPVHTKGCSDCLIGYYHTGSSTLMNYEMYAFHTEHMLTCPCCFFLMHYRGMDTGKYCTL